MKRMIAFLLLVLCILPSFGYAQEDIHEVFTSKDGLLTFEYSNNWFLEERLYAYMNTVVLVNQEEMLPMITSALLLPEQAEIMVQVLPLSGFAFAGLSENSSIEDLKAVFLQIFAAGAITSDEVMFVEYAHPEFEALSSEMYFEAQNYSGYAIWMLPGNGILLQVAVVTPEDHAIKYAGDVEMIANSIAFSGNSEDIKFMQDEQPDEQEFKEFMEVMAETRANDQHNLEILEQLKDGDR